MQSLFELLTTIEMKNRYKLNSYFIIYDWEIDKRRIGIEYVFGRCKTFKILAELYLKRRKDLV